MLRRIALAAVLATSCATAGAGTDVSLEHCDLATGWGVALTREALAFTREGDATPARLSLSDGRL